MIDRLDSDLTINLSELLIRPVTKADLPALEWDGVFTKFRRVYANLYHNTLIGRSLMWVIQNSSGEIVGQAFVMLRSSERDAADGEHRAYVFSFRVKPKWRGKGIGSLLLQHIEDDLLQRGFKLITLNVAKDNPGAIRLYKRMGYQVIGSSPGIWSFKDHQGKMQYVNEPAWRMLKQLPSS